MAKQAVRELRYDFSGGRNTKKSAEALDPNELLDCTNARVNASDASVENRLGSRRMHTTGLGASVDGIFQWDNNGTKQLVAVANGDIHYKTDDYGEFTAVSPTPALGTSPTIFSTMRQSTSGAPLRLYFADGTNVWRWSGSALTQLSGTNSVPANADLVATYHIRNFYHQTQLQQHIYWTVLGDPEDCTVGSKTQGGSAMVDVLRGEGVNSFAVVGSSLVIGTPNSLVRFTGYSSEDIQIEQDTEGISGTVGPVGSLALLRVDNFAAMLADVGPHLLNEAEISDIGKKVEPDFAALDRTVLSSAVVGYHKGRSEIWFAVPGASDSSTNKTVFVYSLDLDAWSGPFTYPFAITCFASWSDSNGDEYIIAGCSDGFVRHMDTGYLDDILAAGTGGSSYTMTVDPAPVYFDTGPGTNKSLQRIIVTGIIPGGGSLSVRTKVDDDSSFTIQKAVSGTSVRKRSYRADVNHQGDCIYPRFVSSTAAQIVINGFTVYGWDLGRPSG